MTLDRFSRSSGTRASTTTRRSTGTLAPSRLDSSSRTRRVGGTESRVADTGATRGRLADSAYRTRSSTIESRLADRNATARARSITEADLQRSRTLGTNERSRDAVREAFRHGRPPAEAAPSPLGKDFDKFQDHDWDDYWDDYWDGYWDGYFDNYGDFVSDNWWWGLFTPFWHFPYYHHHFFGWNYPYFRSHWWFHFHFGYFPIYNHYVYPYYVSYQPVYVPTYSTAVVYQPVYVEPAATEVAPAPTVGEVPPYLAQQLNELAGNETAITWLESGARKFKAGQFEEAADAFRRAMLLEPRNAVPKFALGHTLFALGDYTNAAFMLRRGMQILPQWPSVGTSLHELYGNPDDLAEHTIALRIFLDAQPGDGDARFLLGYVSFFSGDLDAADAAFQSVAATNPTSVETQAFLGRIAEIRAALPADVVEVPTPPGG